MRAVRIDAAASTCSVRDPMFPTAARCLPVPPPTTIAGLLGAASGRPLDPGEVTFAYRATSSGGASDLETYQRIGVGPARYPTRGRGNPVPMRRHFLVDPAVTIWVLTDPDTWLERARRPVWPLRIGRSQDVIHTYRVAVVDLHPAASLVDAGGSVVDVDSGLPGAPMVLPAARSVDQTRSRFAEFVHAPPGATAVAPLVDPERGGVWPLETGL